MRGDGGGETNAGIEKSRKQQFLGHIFPDGSHGLGDPHSEGFQEEGKKRWGQYLKS